MANTDVLNGLKVFPFGEGGSGMVAKIIDHDGPSSYTTGGETINASALGMKRILFVQGAVSAGGGNMAEAAILKKGTDTSFKLVWFVRTTGAEVGAATDLHTDSVKLLVIGIPG